MNCYVDESIHTESGFVVTAFVFSEDGFENTILTILKNSGLSPPQEEYKSSARMDSNANMRSVRDRFLNLAATKAKIAVFFGPFSRSTLGKHTLQALQSVLVRNGIRPEELSVYFDEEIFPSEKEAFRLIELFHYIHTCKVYPRENSKIRLGIQVADAVAHSFGQILKEELSGKPKLVDIGGPGTGYIEGELAPLGWDLLMTLRYGLMTRPMIYNGEPYNAATDPVVLDPLKDDPVDYGQHPILLGWGVQTALEADSTLREGVERAFGRIWLGCIH